MIEFAVWHEGLEEGHGSWVLRIEDGNFLDYPLPRVLLQQAPQASPITLPNRADRRNGLLGRN